MTQEVLKLALDYLESRGLAWNVQIALREALREHAMREVQRLGQEIEQEPVVGITAIRTWFKDGRVVTQTLCNSWVDTTPPQPEQEPVAWMDADGNVSDNNDHKCFPIPLYTAPPQRTWVGLEGEEIRNLWEEATKPDRSTMTMVTSFAKSIEAKLKEKNT